MKKLGAKKDKRGGSSALTLVIFSYHFYDDSLFFSYNMEFW